MDRVLQQRYRIKRVLGRGGRGVVYLCEDLRLRGRLWAIKEVPRQETDGGEAHGAEELREIERETATLSKLRHPNLPVVVDSFEEGSASYLVMEFVDGENLSTWVRRRGTLGEGEAFRLGLTLCGVLAFLHGHDPPIIFRDLKPENVMIDGAGAIKLIDFGLARRFVPGKQSDTVHAGSVGYAAPEQWGDLAQTDRRSDVYSWGATLVFLLTGRIPSHQMPLSALSCLASPLSDAGMAILARCLEVRPEDRYADVAALEHAVRRHVESLPACAADRKADAEGASAGDALPAQAPAGRTVPWPRPILLVALVALALAALVFIPGRLGAWWPRKSAPGGLPASAALLDAVGVAPYRSHGNAADKVAQARKLYADHRWNEAIVVLDMATTQFPEDAQAHILKENAYLRLTGAPCITLPFIGSMTGVDAPDCASDLQGIALAQAIVNARGGIGGKKLLVDCYDDASSTSRCLEIAQRLVNDPNVLVVLGPMNSQRTLAIAPLFNGAHTNLISPTASVRQVWEAGPYVFSASESRGPRIRALARHAVRTGHLRVGGIADATSRLSREMIEIFQAELQARGGTFISLPAFQEDQQDFREQVDAVAKAAPAMIFFADYRGSTLGHFATQLRQRGLQTPICAQTTSMARELVDIGGDSVDGVLLSESFHPKIDNPLTQAFVRAFETRFGDVTPTYPTAENYDAFNAVVEGLEVAHTRQELNTFFRASGVARPAFNGVSGRFALGRCLDARPVWLIEVANGRFRLLASGEAEQAGEPSATVPAPVPPQ